MKILKKRFIKGKYYFKGKIFATIRAVEKDNKYYLIAKSDMHYFKKEYKSKGGLFKGFKSFKIYDLRRKRNEKKNRTTY